ncbi:MAG: DUF2294 family protein [Solirubrobacteraceae bacterium]|nr:DUF2294 family protein [Solirubrobacteraceae bacterium]
MPLSEQTGALVRSLARLTAEHIGRGPNKLRATSGQDMICIVLSGTLTKSERLLVANGEAEFVVNLRRACFRAMLPALEQAARDVTGRDVLAVLSDHNTEADISSVSFVFAPELTEVSSGDLATSQDREPPGDNAPRELAIGLFADADRAWTAVEGFPASASLA